MVLFFTHMPFVVNHTINATPPERLQQYNFNVFAYLFNIRECIKYLLVFISSCFLNLDIVLDLQYYNHAHVHLSRVLFQYRRVQPSLISSTMIFGVGQTT